MNAQKVAEALGVSKASAYKMIHVWNEKLQKLGYTTVSGRISRKYFQEQFYGLTEKLAVGGVTNMYVIAEKMLGAGNVVKP